MNISTEIQAGPMTGYCNSPSFGPWEPNGCESLVLIHVWPNGLSGFDARYEDEAFSVMSGKTCCFRHWSEARDLFLDRIVMQDADRIFRYQVKLHEADPALAKQESEMSVATATKPKTRKRRAANRRVDAAHTDAPPAQAGITLRLDQIAVIYNDRQHFDETELQQLADSITRNGVLQPLLVCADDVPEGYRLIAGERRFRAAKLAGLTEVPVTIRPNDDRGIALARLEENLQRSDLNPIEKAGALKLLIDEQGMTQKQVAAIVGCTQAQVSNQIRLLELPDIWQQWVAAGKLAATSVRPLVSWAKQRPQVLQRLVDTLSADIDEGGFELREHHITDAIQHCTRPLNLAHYHEWITPRSSDCWFRYDAKKHADLDVEKIDGHNNRAWNVDLWKELNAKPLKEAKARYKADQEKRKSANVGPGAKKAEPKTPWTNRMQLESLICRQLLRELAEQLPRANKVALQKTLVYLAGSEAGINCSNAQKAIDLGHTSNSMRLKELGKADAKRWPTTLHKLIKATLLDAAEDNWLNEGLDQVHLIRLLASELFELDLLTNWTPTEEMLDVLETDWLRSTLGKHLNLSPDDRPECPVAVREWLAVDWPAGFIPVDLQPLFKQPK